jgi:hypothetical protein
MTSPPPEEEADTLSAPTSENAVPPNPAGPKAPLSARQQRAALIEGLRKARGSDAVLVYVTSTRPGIGVQMAPDAIRHIFDLLPAQPVAKLDLFIHSNGGDGTVPWRLMTLLRERAEEVDVLVPYHAYSAATLACLGANNVVMHPMGVLGPIDPTIGDPYERDPQSGQPRGVSVEDVASYIALIKEDVGIRHEDELVQAFGKLAERVHPLTLGSAKRGTAQARMLGEKLLKLRDPTMEPHKIASLIEELTTRLYYHGHPIGRKEAKQDLLLPIVEPSKAVEQAMWRLYLAYERELRMDSAFDPVAEALAGPTPPPPAPVTPPPGMPPGMVVAAPASWTVATLPPIRTAVVEGASHADVLENELRVATAPGPDGGVLANVTLIRNEWVRET